MEFFLAESNILFLEKKSHLYIFFFRKKPVDVEVPTVAVFRTFERSSLRSSMRASIRGETLRSSMIQRSSIRSRKSVNTSTEAQRSSIRSRKSVNVATEAESKWIFWETRPWFSTCWRISSLSLLSPLPLSLFLSTIVLSFGMCDTGAVKIK